MCPTWPLLWWSLTVIGPKVQNSAVVVWVVRKNPKYGIPETLHQDINLLQQPWSIIFHPRSFEYVRYPSNSITEMGSPKYSIFAIYILEAVWSISKPESSLRLESSMSLGVGGGGRGGVARYPVNSFVRHRPYMNLSQRICDNICQLSREIKLSIYRVIDHEETYQSTEEPSRNGIVLHCNVLLGIGR